MISMKADARADRGGYAGRSRPIGRTKPLSESAVIAMETTAVYAFANQ
jgi:hypothetical protein